VGLRDTDTTTTFRFPFVFYVCDCGYKCLLWDLCLGGRIRQTLVGRISRRNREGEWELLFFLREYELRIRMLGYRWEIGLDWVDAENIGTWG